MNEKQNLIKEMVGYENRKKKDDAKIWDEVGEWFTTTNELFIIEPQLVFREDSVVEFATQLGFYCIMKLKLVQKDVGWTRSIHFSGSPCNNII